MPSSSIDNFWTELQTDLAARGGLSGVTVTTYPLGIDQAPLSAIQLHSVEDWVQTQLGMGSSAPREETYTIVGLIIEKGTNRGETDWTAIRTTFFATLAEIEAQCTSYIDTPATNAASVQFVGGEIRTVVIDGDPGYECEFRIDVESHRT